MKTACLILLLAACAFPQTQDETLIAMAKTLNVNPKATWKTYIDVRGWTIPSGIVTDSAVEAYVVDLPVHRKGESQKVADEAFAQIWPLFRNVDDSSRHISLTVTASERYERHEYSTISPTYRVSPIRVVTYCGPLMCTSSAYGGGVYASQGTVSIPASRNGAVTAWKNY